MINLADELATDIMSEGPLSFPEAQKIASFLIQEGLVDYDTLKEYYLDEGD